MKSLQTCSQVQNGIKLSMDLIIASLQKPKKLHTYAYAGCLADSERKDRRGCLVLFLVSYERSAAYFLSCLPFLVKLNIVPNRIQEIALGSIYFTSDYCHETMCQRSQLTQSVCRSSTRVIAISSYQKCLLSFPVGRHTFQRFRWFCSRRKSFSVWGNENIPFPTRSYISFMTQRYTNRPVMRISDFILFFIIKKGIFRLPYNKPSQY